MGVSLHRTGALRPRTGLRGASVPDCAAAHGRVVWRVKAGDRRADGDRGPGQLTARRPAAEFPLVELWAGFAAAALSRGRHPSRSRDYRAVAPDPAEKVSAPTRPRTPAGAAAAGADRIQAALLRAQHERYRAGSGPAAAVATGPGRLMAWMIDRGQPRSSASDPAARPHAGHFSAQRETPTGRCPGLWRMRESSA